MYENIIFLDIDGVLNSTSFEICLKWRGKGKYKLDPNAVCLLAELVERTKAKIVISSSWRTDYPLDEFDPMFQSILPSWKSCVIDSTTVNAGTGIRGHEIALWLKHNPTKRYIILDDMGHEGFMKEQHPYYIETNHHYGILIKDIAKALKLLGCKDSLANEYLRATWSHS